MRLSQIFTNKLHSLEEMNKFLNNIQSPKTELEEIENTNRLITGNEIKSIVKKKIQQTKVQDQIASQVNSTKHLKKS